jgi:hypothetical protein
MRKRTKARDEQFKKGKESKRRKQAGKQRMQTRKGGEDVYLALEHEGLGFRCRFGPLVVLNFLAVIVNAVVFGLGLLKFLGVTAEERGTALRELGLRRFFNGLAELRR